MLAWGFSKQEIAIFGAGGGGGVGPNLWPELLRILLL